MDVLFVCLFTLLVGFGVCLLRLLVVLVIMLHCFVALVVGLLG